MTQMIRSLAFAALFSALVIGATLSNIRLDWLQRTPRSDSGPIYLPQAKYLRPMSLGYHNALADILWFRAISYFGAHYRSDRTYPWLSHICELVTDLDPRAEHVYRFGGLILPWEAGKVDEGIALLEKGVKNLPDSVQLSYFLGFSYFFFKGDNKKALQHLRHASSLPGTHPGIARLTAVLSAETLGPRESMRFLAELEQSVDSPNVREVVRENLKEMALASMLEEIDAAIDTYRSRTGEAPPSIEALVAAGDLGQIPPDPFGGHFEIDAETGSARSSTGKTPSRLHTSRLRERALGGKAGKELLDH